MIELVRPFHDFQWSEDAERQAFLENPGCIINRFSNQLVMDEIDIVIRGIKEICNRLNQSHTDSVEDHECSGG